VPPAVRWLAVLIAASAVLVPLTARAGIMDWEKLADDPDSYIGKPVEVLGYSPRGRSRKIAAAWT
jgi:hypothetical protein